MGPVDQHWWHKDAPNVNRVLERQVINIMEDKINTYTYMLPIGKLI